MTNIVSAVSPTELVTAQKSTLTYINERIEFVKLEIADAEKNLEHALQSHWAVKPFRNLLNKQVRRLNYFEKIKAAIQKGYLIMPSIGWPEGIALRVKDGNKVRWDGQRICIQKNALGVGEWIDHKAVIQDHIEENENGRRFRVTDSKSTNTEIDFPVALIKPEVLDATQIAMADKIFDRIALATDSGDPIVLGEIYHPTVSYRRITFFIAWFLDVRTLNA